MTRHDRVVRSAAPDRNEINEVLREAARASEEYLGGLDGALVRPPGMDEYVNRLGGSMPESGVGAVDAIRELSKAADAAALRSSGPRFFHWVTGGVTPAALAADWIASAHDQNPASWDGSPLASRLEEVTLAWIRQLCGLPQDWGGVLTTGATMANYVGLAAARQWAGERVRADVARDGLHSVQPPRIFGGGLVHASIRKALSMLGLGRDRLEMVTTDPTGRIDLRLLEAKLAALHGAPAIVCATAGDVNTGAFDPIERLVELRDRYGCWLHVDGAFGLFARVVPSASHLAAGIERADSVTADGHKWLNLPYDCGFAFVATERRLLDVFGSEAAYLPPVDGSRPNFGALGPEGSRRARSFALWATLRAYGRRGIQQVVERHIALARYLADAVDATPNLERLADVELNVVCFRYWKSGWAEANLNELNRQLGIAIVTDGRVYVGTTVYGGRVALRPAIVNWRTRQADIDLLLDVVRHLGSAIATDLVVG